MLLYLNLIKLITVCRPFLHSNASSKRLFSQIKLIKSDNRASMNHKMLLTLTRSKKHIQSRASVSGNSAANFEPSSEIIRRHSKMNASAGDSLCNELRRKFMKDMRSRNHSTKTLKSL